MLLIDRIKGIDIDRSHCLSQHSLLSLPQSATRVPQRTEGPATAILRLLPSKQHSSVDHHVCYDDYLYYHGASFLFANADRW